jgi:Ran GTPase-activating protein (RanGAP) involved in mRNA processing and transport
MSSLKLIGSNMSPDTIDYTNQALTDIEVDNLCNEIRDNDFLRKVYLSGTELSQSSIEKICNVLLHDQKIVELDLSDNNITTSSLKYINELIKVNQHLLYIDLDHNDLTYADIKKISKAIQKNNMLFDISLDGNIDNETAIGIIDTKTQDNKIRFAATTLVACALGTESVNLATLTKIIQNLIVFSLQTNQHILTICSKYMPIYPEIKITIAKFLNKNKNLYAFVAILNPPVKDKTISFSGMTLDGIHIDILFYILSHNLGITGLDLSGIKIGPRKFQDLSVSLSLNKQLEFLDLSNTVASNSLILLDVLPDIKTLKGLNLSGVDLNDEAVRKLAILLKTRDSQLEVLDLSNTKISFNGLMILTDALQGNTKLKGLDLSDNAIGTNDWAVQLIVKIMKHTKNLTMLNLNNCILKPKHCEWICNNASNLQEIELDDNIQEIINQPEERKNHLRAV